MKTIKLLRIFGHKSQFQLSLETEIPSYRLSRIENGKVDPTSDELDRLAGALNTTSERLEGEIPARLIEKVAG